MKQILIVVGLLFFLVGCSSYKRTNYNVNSKMLTLNLNSEKHATIKLDNPKYQRFPGECILDNFMLVDNNSKYKRLYVQHISINSDCTWNELAQNSFIQNIKNNLKVKDVNLMNMQGYKNMHFTELEIDGMKGANLIEIWGANYNTFIFYEDGNLYEDLKSQIQ